MRKQNSTLTALFLMSLLSLSTGCMMGIDGLPPQADELGKKVYLATIRADGDSTDRIKAVKFTRNLTAQVALKDGLVKKAPVLKTGNLKQKSAQKQACQDEPSQESGQPSKKCREILTNTPQLTPSETRPGN